MSEPRLEPPVVDACECGAAHCWITWRGYRLGPVPESFASKIPTDPATFEGELAQAMTQNPMLGMLLGILVTIPESPACDNEEEK